MCWPETSSMPHDHNRPFSAIFTAVTFELRQKVCRQNRGHQNCLFNEETRRERDEDAHTCTKRLVFSASCPSSPLRTATPPDDEGSTRRQSPLHAAQLCTTKNVSLDGALRLAANETDTRNKTSDHSCEIETGSNASSHCALSTCVVCSTIAQQTLQQFQELWFSSLTWYNTVNRLREK